MSEIRRSTRSLSFTSTVLASLFGVSLIMSGVITTAARSDGAEGIVAEVPLLTPPSLEESAHAYNRYRSGVGFSFSYPTGYELTVGHPDDSTLEEYIVFLRQQDVDDPEPPFVSLKVYANPDQLTLETFREELGYYIVQEFPDTTIAGQRTLDFESAGLYMDRQYLFKTPDGNRVVALHAASEFEELWQMTEGIRDSFQW